jgi:hypothetical protein
MACCWRFWPNDKAYASSNGGGCRRAVFGKRFFRGRTLARVFQPKPRSARAGPALSSACSIGCRAQAPNPFATDFLFFCSQSLCISQPASCLSGTFRCKSQPASRFCGKESVGRAIQNAPNETTARRASKGPVL